MQSNTPLYSKLLQFQSEHNVSFHVPGHKNGLLNTMDDYRWRRNLLEFDVTELTNLDDLHSPTGVIAEAELLLSTFYKVKRSFFLVNGSTVGNLAMILATVKEGERVFVQRNSHKSIMNGIKLAKGNPIMLQAEYEEDWKVETVLSIDIVQKAINKYPDVKTLIITSPNYYGMVGDIDGIIKLAHQYGICVLVDEAHGAHFKGSTIFPQSAVECGADIVVQSAHKTLPALTMGAYLHYNTNKVKQESVKKYLEMLQSSSPSYLIMASLDKARHFLATYQREDEVYLMDKINYFRSELKKIPQLEVLEYPVNGDPLKITIQSKCLYSGIEIQQKLEEEGIYTELADSHNILLVFPLLKRDMSYPLEKTVNVIRKVLSNSSTIKSSLNKLQDAIKKETNIVELKLSEKEQANLEKVSVFLDDAVHSICAEEVIPYPPGVPILMSGEEITSYHISQLKRLIHDGAKFQGNKSIYQGKIIIYKYK